jgi:translation initiation factor IF-2
VIIGFNVRPEARAADVAKQEAVDIRLHSIIYKGLVQQSKVHLPQSHRYE